MPGLSFLNKKSWHTTNVKNVERVWLAEKKAEEEQKRLAELQKQLQEERQILELRQLQAAQGQVTKTIDNSLDWMYEGPVSSNQKQQSSEEYLLGKIYNAAADHSKVDTAIPDTKAPAKWLNKVASKNDSFSRAHEDPFVMIKQEENRRREKVVNNPIKMDKIKQKIASELQEKDEKKRQKKLAKREKKEQKKESKRRKKESRSGEKDQRNNGERDDSSSSSDESGSEKEYVKREGSRSPERTRAVASVSSSAHGHIRNRSRSPSPARDSRRAAPTVDRQEPRDGYNRDSKPDRDNRDRPAYPSREQPRDSRDSRDRGDGHRNRDRQNSRDRSDRYDRDQRAPARGRDDFDRREDRAPYSRDSHRDNHRDFRDRDGRDSRRSNSRSRESRNRHNDSGNSNSASSAQNSHNDARKRPRSPSPVARAPAADRTRTTRHTMQSESEDSEVSSGARKPKQLYGLLPNKNRFVDPNSTASAGSSTSNSSNLGPNPALLQKKIDAEKAAEAERRNRARGDVRGLTEEERQKRILAMQEDAQTNDVVRATRHDPERAVTETADENTGNAAFLESMRKTVYTTNDIDMQSRIDQNKYNRQSSAEIDSADGFLRK